MASDTTKLTVRLPKRDVEFVKRYARRHGITVTEVIDRYLRRMRRLDEDASDAGLEEIRGLVPADCDAEGEYREHLRRKHSS